ncbi:MAG: hypothetical protein IIA44_12295 [Acidobacteria bacterium]|nr:hypothetical protein [Acidobacteriota bacterium]
MQPTSGVLHKEMAVANIPLAIDDGEQAAANRCQQTWLAMMKLTKQREFAWSLALLDRSAHELTVLVIDAHRRGLFVADRDQAVGEFVRTHSVAVTKRPVTTPPLEYRRK